MNEDNFLITEIVQDEEVITDTNIVVNEVFQTHMTDHQYISFDSQQASQLDDFSKKEMDVFDYIGIEIKNIQEQEEREKERKAQNKARTEELAQVEEHLIEDYVDEYFVDANDIKTDEDVEETIVFEKLESSECDDEFQNYVEVISESSFQCKLCPKIYQRKNITAKHLKVEHQIILKDYNYDSTNRLVIFNIITKYLCNYYFRLWYLDTESLKKISIGSADFVQSVIQAKSSLKSMKFFMDPTEISATSAHAAHFISTLKLQWMLINIRHMRINWYARIVVKDSTTQKNLRVMSSTRIMNEKEQWRNITSFVNYVVVILTPKLQFLITNEVAVVKLQFTNATFVSKIIILLDLWSVTWQFIATLSTFHALFVRRNSEQRVNWRSI